MHRARISVYLVPGARYKLQQQGSDPKMFLGGCSITTDKGASHLLTFTESPIRSGSPYVNVEPASVIMVVDFPERVDMPGAEAIMATL